ncbi:DUF418 domain-containing protein [Paenibacillus sp. HWE-109]|uniref:DUF418 domain-containing protein n=1 Tax=Paenibacillus sp. HWE-109 TaxID=1306526 RepID=UPI001EDD61E1|nr:DUF418 domain-containing protein [Paenibacillus sp. HWE-109]UKS28644.1 DUF418 domain-containing protein [Paenibacillus sp. HWE-109]
MSASAQRITALDFARALAIFGMIIVNYKLAMEADNGGAAWLIAVAGLFEGRAAALFVILAGIGVSLMTSKAYLSRNKDLIRQNRSSLLKRAGFLLLAGAGLLLMGWNADILHYYALFLLVASTLITLSDKKILLLFVGLLVTSQFFLIVFDYSLGWDSRFHVYTDFWTLAGFSRNLLLNGFHPFFPWFCFFLIGMWIGRKRWLGTENRAKLLIYALLGTVFFETVSFLLIKWSYPFLDLESASYLFTTKPMPPTMLYILSATCLALAVIAISLYMVDICGNFLVVRMLMNTGQLSLTHYVGHIIIGLGFLELIHFLENGNLSFSIAYGCGYFIIAVLFSYVWRKWMKRGPIEWVMRRLS